MHADCWQDMRMPTGQLQAAAAGYDGCAWNYEKFNPGSEGALEDLGTVGVVLWGVQMGVSVDVSFHVLLFTSLMLGTGRLILRG